jgi:hypothetical protein
MSLTAAKRSRPVAKSKFHAKALIFQQEFRYLIDLIGNKHEKNIAESDRSPPILGHILSIYANSVAFPGTTSSGFRARSGMPGAPAHSPRLHAQTRAPARIFALERHPSASATSPHVDAASPAPPGRHAS